MTRVKWLSVSLCLACGLLSSCRQLSFYGQAAYGQWQLSTQSKPISELKKHPRTTPELIKKFELVEEILEFADQELHLPVKKQYSRYLDLGRPHLVWNVFAAPEFSLQARTWTYPFVGKLAYRGFFKESEAREEAARWKAKGDDVTIGGVRAYSTLGWFSDPLLNTFIQDDEAELADLIFHELTHAKLFIRGDTSFNEAFATANARIGVRRWFKKKWDLKKDLSALKKLDAYEKSILEEQLAIQIMRDTQFKLKNLYVQKNLEQETMRERKKGIMAEAARDYRNAAAAGKIGPEYAPLFEKRLNNARLSSIATYYDWVPAFEQLHASVDGDLELFYQEVQRMGKLDFVSRRQSLKMVRTPKKQLE